MSTTGDIARRHLGGKIIIMMAHKQQPDTANILENCDDTRFFERLENATLADMP